MEPLSHDMYIELAMHFNCNLKCEHCMIEETMQRLKPETTERFQRLLAENERHGRWRGLVLTGAEISLYKDLAELASEAKRRGFQRVRIQTHGMRLADYDYCRRLVDSGVDEFFVSVTASDEANHDAITGVPGSFHKTMQGLENLDRCEGVISLSNTVVTRRSYEHLPGIVDALSHLRNLVQMEFWTYWPMGEIDKKNLVVSHLKVLPHLRTAIRNAKRLGRTVEVKNFPECLLGEDRDVLINSQPQLEIDSAFWDEFRKNGFHQCVYKEACHSKQCLGLNTAYIAKFGWMESDLNPLPVVPDGQAESPTGSNCQ